MASPPYALRTGQPPKHSTQGKRIARFRDKLAATELDRLVRDVGPAAAAAVTCADAKAAITGAPFLSGNDDRRALRSHIYQLVGRPAPPITDPDITRQELINQPVQGPTKRRQRTPSLAAHHSSSGEEDEEEGETSGDSASPPRKKARFDGELPAADLEGSSEEVACLLSCRLFGIKAQTDRKQALIATIAAHKHSASLIPELETELQKVVAHTVELDAELSAFRQSLVKCPRCRKSALKTFAFGKYCSPSHWACAACIRGYIDANMDSADKFPLRCPGCAEHGAPKEDAQDCVPVAARDLVDPLCVRAALGAPYPRFATKQLGAEFIALFAPAPVRCPDCGATSSACSSQDSKVGRCLNPACSALFCRMCLSAHFFGPCPSVSSSTQKK
jgi:hypothetical protein